jgi:general stress protein 26
MSKPIPKEQLAERKEAIKTLEALMKEIGVAMLTTRSKEGELHSRPMLPAKTKFDGDLWFISERQDPKVEEIKLSSQVGVTFSDPGGQRYVAISGEAEVIEDGGKLEVLWDDEFGEWFPGGLQAHELILLVVRVRDAEFWRSQGSSVVNFTEMFRGPAHGKSHEHRENERVAWPGR